ncbi:MAG: ATP synthase F1 subunit epsilon [Deltaproteobacteria bacterium]|jgi:F-type H+-transporting ATPase subunit epsilon|nr:ATP synthase F1 subunit epsilon [Deltaproteobacteria bacterium]
MSQRQFSFTVVSPDKVLYKDSPALAVGAVGVAGEFTALPGHMPFLTSLAPGTAWYRTLEDEVKEIFVEGGFVEVLPDRVTILAEAAYQLEEIDEEKDAAETRKLEDYLKNAKIDRKESAGTPGYQESLKEIQELELQIRKNLARMKFKKERKRKI